MNKLQIAKRLIKQYEGYSETAYYCAANVLTIGYGRTTNVQENERTTREAEEQYLSKEIAKADLLINANVTRALNAAQMGALISFVYNIGPSAFRNSTLLNKLNDGTSFGNCADELLRWCKVGTNVLPGLVKRRMAEYNTFLQ